MGNNNSSVDYSNQNEFVQKYISLLVKLSFEGMHKSKYGSCLSIADLLLFLACDHEQYVNEDHQLRLMVRYFNGNYMIYVKCFGINLQYTRENILEGICTNIDSKNIRMTKLIDLFINDIVLLYVSTDAALYKDILKLLENKETSGALLDLNLDNTFDDVLYDIHNQLNNIYHDESLSIIEESAKIRQNVELKLETDANNECLQLKYKNIAYIDEYVMSTIINEYGAYITYLTEHYESRILHTDHDKIQEYKKIYNEVKKSDGLVLSFLYNISSYNNKSNTSKDDSNILPVMFGAIALPTIPSLSSISSSEALEVASTVMDGALIAVNVIDAITNNI